MKSASAQQKILWTKQWQESGHAVFPLNGKIPKVKFSKDENCHMDYDATEWGLRLDKLLVVDIDSYKTNFTAQEFMVNLLVRNVPCTVTPRGGVHYFYKICTAIPRHYKGKPDNTAGVDIKTGRGAYVRIYGPPPEHIPYITRELEAALEKRVPVGDDVCSSDIHIDLEGLLNKISSDVPYDEWFPVLIAIKKLGGKEAREIAWVWSAGSSRYHHNPITRSYFDAIWRGIKPRATATYYLRRLKGLAHE